MRLAIAAMLVFAMAVLTGAQQVDAPAQAHFQFGGEVRLGDVLSYTGMEVDVLSFTELRVRAVTGTRPVFGTSSVPPVSRGTLTVKCKEGFSAIDLEPRR